MYPLTQPNLLWSFEQFVNSPCNMLYQINYVRIHDEVFPMDFFLCFKWIILERYFTVDKHFFISHLKIKFSTIFIIFEKFIEKSIFVKYAI